MCYEVNLAWAILVETEGLYYHLKPVLRTSTALQLTVACLQGRGLIMTRGLL